MVARVKPVPVMAVAVLFALGALVAAHGTGSTPPALSAAEGRRVEILFLGHTGTQHDSARFAPMLKAALAPVRLQLLVHDRPGRPERGQSRASTTR